MLTTRFQPKFAALFLICLLATISAADEPEIRVLFLGDNGHHQPRARFSELQPALATRGIQLTYSDNPDDLNLKKLAQYDALILYANIDEIKRAQADALLEYVAKGGGFVPLHCATYCFRNVPEVVALMGGQFKRHGTGVFRSEVARSRHPLTKGYGGFQSWDETYVHHLHNEKNRTVLEYRVDKEGREPWTWIRTEGKGRVFYTAWGHDSRTWTHPGFQNLVERGIRWAVKKDPQDAGNFLADLPFPKPKMKPLPTDLKPFEFEDVGAQIPNYTPSRQWGTQGKPLNKMQKPVPPSESMRHLVVPEGFHVELFAAEPDIGGKPICMAWDARGRLWIAETYDYPNELQPAGKGRDRIRICEDTDGDGKADRFTVFAERLSIPTSIAFYKQGVLVQDGTSTVFLKDTDGDDRADERRVLVENWALGDTHGGVSNFQYGLDNWVWAMQGYNNSEPIAAGKRQQRFRMGFFRMRPDGSEIEFIRSTNNNTWGLGISEEGLIFGSTANGNPSIYMPIPNRYYESVRGWTPSLTLSSIADTNKFQPITPNIRQVDHHGGYTAAAGHSLYTAREYPKEYWNRVAFVNGPTGHLVGSFVLQNRGTDFSSTSPFNLLASDDQWTAPIMSEVGPDGQVWVIDWYNYIVQHNPTPKGFKTGKGGAYETGLRDKKYGRIYRVVADQSRNTAVPNLEKATPQELVAALRHPTMLIRKHAQRLLVERAKTDVAPDLIALVADQKVDEIGLNVGAIHGLWTLQGLGLLDGSYSAATAAAYSALKHPSAGVRRNAVQVLPGTEESVAAILAARLPFDRNAHVRLASLLALADLPPTESGAKAIAQVINNPTELYDRWIPDAACSAAANHDRMFLGSLATANNLPDRAITIVERVANHFARSDQTDDAAEMLAGLENADPRVSAAVLKGLGQGWRDDKQVRLSAAVELRLVNLLKRLDSGSQGLLVKLANRWGSRKFSQYVNEISDSLLEKLRDSEADESERIKAVNQLVDFLSNDSSVVKDLLGEVSARTPPRISTAILRALERSRAENVGQQIVTRLSGLTPSLKRTAIATLLKRPASTKALLATVETGKVSLDELALDQKQALANHADPGIQATAKRLLKRGGSLPNADRQKVLEELLYVTKQKGNVVNGKAMFKEHCSKCHVYNGVGVKVGPDLTGMSVHPKQELLTHILDPSRNVEGNFRAYSVGTIDGLSLTGMLASESKTSIELFDTEGKKQSVLRDDIEIFRMSSKSIMPEGFEKSMKPNQLSDLLEYLTQRGKFVPVDIRKVATLPSDRSMFADPQNTAERLIFPDWKPKTVDGVPFLLIDPENGTVANTILLHGPLGAITRKMPKAVSIPCQGSVKAIHMLSGVAGWGHPYGKPNATVLIVRLHYADGQTEDHPLMNGKHFADYIRRVDVPGSKFAFPLRGQQIRYLSVQPKRNASITKIDLLKGDGDSAPVVMAITLESGDAKE